MRCHILELPGEFRNHIYCYLGLVAPSILVILDGLPVPHALAWTCRKLRAECLHMSASLDTSGVERVDAIIYDSQPDRLEHVARSISSSAHTRGVVIYLASRTPGPQYPSLPAALQTSFIHGPPTKCVHPSCLCWLWRGRCRICLKYGTEFKYTLGCPCAASDGYYYNYESVLNMFNHYRPTSYYCHLFREQRKFGTFGKTLSGLRPAMVKMWSNLGSWQ